MSRLPQSNEPAGLALPARVFFYLQCCPAKTRVVLFLSNAKLAFPGDHRYGAVPQGRDTTPTFQNGKALWE